MKYAPMVEKFLFFTPWSTSSGVLYSSAQRICFMFKKIAFWFASVGREVIVSYKN
jgi:hypothetical protein